MLIFSEWYLPAHVGFQSGYREEFRSQYQWWLRFDRKEPPEALQNSQVWGHKSPIVWVKFPLLGCNCSSVRLTFFVQAKMRVMFQLQKNTETTAYPLLPMHDLIGLKCSLLRQLSNRLLWSQYATRMRRDVPYASFCRNNNLCKHK